MSANFDMVTVKSREDFTTISGPVYDYSELKEVTLHTTQGPVTYAAMEWHDTPNSLHYGELRTNVFEGTFKNANRTAVQFFQQADGTWKGERRYS